MKKILPIIFSICILVNANAQTEYSVFTSTGRGVSTTLETDYHAVGINPANLGFKRKYENKHITFGLLEIGVSAYSGALSKDEFRNNIFDVSGPSFTSAQKMKAALQFADEKVALNGDVNIFGIAYQNDNIGGFAFNIRESARWYSKFNDSLAQVMFLGYKAPYFQTLVLNNGATVANDPSNYAAYDAVGISKGVRTPGTELALSQLFNGSKISALYTREFNLSYGKEFTINDNFILAGGIGVKYVQGYGMIDVDIKNNQLVSRAAFSPAFNIDFGKAALTNPSSDSSDAFSPAGKGYGFDLGINLEYKEKLKFGVAVTNIGAINWNTNVYTVQNTELTDLKTAGFNSYNIFNEASKMVSNNGIFKWQGKEKLKTNLPTTLRMGASYLLGERGDIAVDLVIPMNQQPGSISKPYWALGGDFNPLRWLRLSAGLAHGGNYDQRINIPVGLTFIIGENGTWEFGVASRDAVTYFREKGPALSVAFGFLRFRV